jgi:hypothetical protein
MVNPEQGFTSDVITDPNRFIGRIDLIRSCMQAINSPNSLLGPVNTNKLVHNQCKVNEKTENNIQFFKPREYTTEAF